MRQTGKRRPTGRDLLEHVDWAMQTDRIRGWFYHRIPASDVDDVVQEVMLAALESADRFDPAANPQVEMAGRLEAWLSGIARFKLLEYFDRRRRQRRSLEQLMDRLDAGAVSGGAPNAMEIGEAMHAIKAALDDARPALLEVAGLYFQGKSPEEIGQALNLSPSAVYKRLSRLRKGLQSKIHGETSADAVPEIVYSSPHGLLAAIQQWVLPEEEHLWDREERAREFSRLLDSLVDLSPSARQRLQAAHQAIDGREDLAGEDKVYVSEQLRELAPQLERGSLRKMLRTSAARRIRTAAPQVFEMLSARR